MRQCNRCFIEKEDDKFYFNRNSLSRECKDCKRVRTMQQPNRKYVIWKSNIKTKYNLTVEQYDKMLDDQNGVCAACFKECGHGGRLSVDHDHACCQGDTSCGKCVRGLLCRSCNFALGALRDDPDVIRGLLRYIEGQPSLTPYPDIGW